MRILFFCIILIQLISLSSFAAPKGELIIVHATAAYDRNHVSSEGIANITDLWEKNNFPVHHLEDPRLQVIRPSFAKALDHHFIHESINGEHQITPTSNEVTLVGGYYHDCLTYAMAWVILNWAKNTTLTATSTLTINLYTPGIYVRNKHTNGDYQRLPEHKLNPEVTLNHFFPTAVENGDIADMFYAQSYAYDREDDEGNGFMRGFYEDEHHLLVSEAKHHLILKYQGKIIEEFGHRGNPQIIVNYVSSLN